jgi:hypothetical protein
VRPEGIATSRAAWAWLAVAVGALCVAAGVWVAVLLPGSVGTVDSLIGLVLVVVALVLTIWFALLARRARNWLRESLDRGAIAPLRPSFAPDSDSRNGFSVLASVLMVAAIPLMLIYGPLIGLISLVHGFDDRAIVSVLRQHGVSTLGTIQAIVTQSPDGDGGENYTTTIWLNFSLPDGQSVSTTDPGINGWTWPASQPNVEIVYLPSHPTTAAVAGQLVGSPWRGAVTGNLIAGVVLTVLLVPLAWALGKLRADDKE